MNLLGGGRALSSPEPSTSSLTSLGKGDGSILSLLAVVAALFCRSRLPVLNSFSCGLKVHDLVYALVKFYQCFTFILLEFIPEWSIGSHPGDCCHHHPILLRVMYRRQFIIEALDVSLQRFIWSLLDVSKALKGVAYLRASWNWRINMTDNCPQEVMVSGSTWRIHFLAIPNSVIAKHLQRASNVTCK